MILQVFISILTIISMWMLGNRSIWGWYVSLLSQFLWLAFIIMTRTWGLLPLNVAMWVNCIHGIRKWSKPEPKPIVEDHQ